MRRKVAFDHDCKIRVRQVGRRTDSLTSFHSPFPLLIPHSRFFLS